MKTTPLVPFVSPLTTNPGPSAGDLKSRTRASQQLPAGAAKEFESILIGQWLQSAESSFASVPGADDDGDAEDEQLKSYGVQQLATALSNAGGIGIATMVTKALSHRQPGSIHDPEQAVKGTQGA